MNFPLTLKKKKKTTGKIWDRLQGGMDGNKEDYSQGTDFRERQQVLVLRGLLRHCISSNFRQNPSYFPGYTE